MRASFLGGRAVVRVHFVPVCGTGHGLLPFAPAGRSDGCRRSPPPAPNPQGYYRLHAGRCVEHSRYASAALLLAASVLASAALSGGADDGAAPAALAHPWHYSGAAGGEPYPAVCAALNDPAHAHVAGYAAAQRAPPALAPPAMDHPTLPYDPRHPPPDGGAPSWCSPAAYYGHYAPTPSAYSMSHPPTLHRAPAAPAWPHAYGPFGATTPSAGYEFGYLAGEAFHAGDAARHLPDRGILSMSVRFGAEGELRVELPAWDVFGPSGGDLDPTPPVDHPT